MLAGVAPIPANSGQVTTRHRLNRHGDRQLNRALHTIALSRIRYDKTTRHYVARRTSGQGQPRDQTLPQALHRPPPLPAAGIRSDHGSTIHRSVDGSLPRKGGRWRYSDSIT